MIKKWLFILMMIVVLFFLGNHFFNAPEAQAPEKAIQQPNVALSVDVAQVQEQVMPFELMANGDVVAWQEAVIGSEVADLRLAEIHADVGDHVKAGQVLAVFDTRAIEADIAQARASLAEAKALYIESHENAKRARSLKGSGAMSQQQITQYLSTEKAALARIDVARAALEVQQFRLKRAVILAPDDGVISARQATVGAVTGFGGELFRIVRQNRLEWRAELGAAELARLSPGVVAELMINNGQKVQGIVRVVAPTINERTRLGLVYVDLENSNQVRPGMYARGLFKLGEGSALSVPLQSIVMREAFSYVFVLKSDNRVEQRKIGTGRRFGGEVEILAGLSLGEKIVTSGAGFLNDGDLVRVVNNNDRPMTQTIDEAGKSQSDQNATREVSP